MNNYRATFFPSCIALILKKKTFFQENLMRIAVPEEGLRFKLWISNKKQLLHSQLKVHLRK